MIVFVSLDVKTHTVNSSVIRGFFPLRRYRSLHADMVDWFNRNCDGAGDVLDFQGVTVREMFNKRRISMRS